MDAMNYHETEEPRVSRRRPVINQENYRQVVMTDDKALLRTDVVARVKAMGVRDYRDRVVLAIQNDDLRPTIGGLFSRAAVDAWVEDELAVDRLEDELTISLAQARSLAREAGIENYSMEVLNAITRMEIEGVEYRRGQPRIRRDAFEEWLEYQGSAGEVEDLIRLDPELLNIPEPTSGEVFRAGLEMYGWYALGFAASVWVICWVLWNVAHVAG